MPNRTVTVFFYGLFMDGDLLRSKGVHALNVRAASVDGYAIRIGNRATLVQESDSSAYGMLMDLTHSDIDTLYSAPGLETYRPAPVVAATADGSRIPALCFNLVTPPAPDEANLEYAGKLRELARRLALPADYVERIR